MLGQVDVAGKTNEITEFRPLLDPIDLARTVVTADALHTQREHADWLVSVKKAAYICVVKRNQPGLYRQLNALPWRQVPAGDDTPHPGAWPGGDPSPAGPNRDRRGSVRLDGGLTGSRYDF